MPKDKIMSHIEILSKNTTNHNSEG